MKNYTLFEYKLLNNSYLCSAFEWHFIRFLATIILNSNYYCRYENLVGSIELLDWRF